MTKGVALNSPGISSTRFGKYGRMAPSFEGFLLGEESRINKQPLH
jgi:hypothetical protein